MDRKIHIGDKVAYKNPETAIGKLFPSGTVENIIPDGMPLGNGERNTCGQDILLCKPDGPGKTLLIFREEELTLI